MGRAVMIEWHVKAPQSVLVKVSHPSVVSWVHALGAGSCAFTAWPIYAEQKTVAELVVASKLLL